MAPQSSSSSSLSSSSSSSPPLRPLESSPVLRCSSYSASWSALIRPRPFANPSQAPKLLLMSFLIFFRSWSFWGGWKGGGERRGGGGGWGWGGGGGGTHQWRVAARMGIKIYFFQFFRETKIFSSFTSWYKRHHMDYMDETSTRSLRTPIWTPRRFKR